jgi:hypothetical protein
VEQLHHQLLHCQLPWLVQLQQRQILLPLLLLVLRLGVLVLLLLLLPLPPLLLLLPVHRVAGVTLAVLVWVNLVHQCQGSNCLTSAAAAMRIRLLLLQVIPLHLSAFVH